jgi:hypothetical protein
MCEVTPWNKAPLQKLTVVMLVKTSSSFVKAEGSLRVYIVPISLCHEPDESSPFPHKQFLLRLQIFRKNTCTTSLTAILSLLLINIFTVSTGFDDKRSSTGSIDISSEVNSYFA